MLPITREHGVHSANCDLPAQLQPDALGGVEIDDADTRARVHEEIERLFRLRDGDFDPEKPFTILKRKFAGSGCGCFAASNRNLNG